MKKTIGLTTAAIIAALYVVLTLFAGSLGLASGAIQVRFSECLTILPFFTPYAIPGLFVGCIISNILTGCVFFDIIFGSIATLIGAVGTYYIGKLSMKAKKWIAPLPPIIANTIIVPFVLAYAYGVEDSIPFLMLTVGAGEIISAGLLGYFVMLTVIKSKIKFN